MLIDSCIVSLSLRLKDLLGPITRVKKKKKRSSEGLWTRQDGDLYAVLTEPSLEAVALLSKDGKVIPPPPSPRHPDPQHAAAPPTNITTSNHITTKEPLRMHQSRSGLQVLEGGG